MLKDFVSNEFLVEDTEKLYNQARTLDFLADMIQCYVVSDQVTVPSDENLDTILQMINV